MSHKDQERNIGEIFIEEYNLCNNSKFRLDEKYLTTRDENDFPDLKFINHHEIYAEVVRATSPEFEKRTDCKCQDLELIEVSPQSEIFIAIRKKDKKHYDKAADIILIVHLPFYSNGLDVQPLVTLVKNRGYNFKEIWAVWEDRLKNPTKLA